MIKTVKLIFVIIAAALIFVFAAVTPLFACTGVIIGSDLTEDGRVIFGRVEDYDVNHNKVYKIVEAGKYKKGEIIKDVSRGKDGYEYEFPHDSYRFTAVSDTTPEYGIFDEAGFNEKGLMVDMTVSASANSAVKEVDPYLDGSFGERCGINEAIMATVVLGSSDSARAAVELIANEVAEKGAAEGNTFVVADKDEVWYMEIYTGHQFVAMKYPMDKFSVFPNTYWLGETTLDIGLETPNFNVSSDGNYIYSNEIFEVAKTAGTFAGNEAARIINLAASYAPEELTGNNRSRICSGIMHFKPEANIDENADSFDFLHESLKKISLEDVFTFTYNRLESIGKVADDFSDELYPIGNRNSLEAHVFVVNKNATEEYPGVMYLALGSPQVSPFVAYYPNQTDAIPQATNESNSFNTDSVYWTVMDIMHMVELNRGEFMKVVERRRNEAQARLVSGVFYTPADAEATTKKNMEDAALAFETLQKIREELKPMYETYLANNDVICDLGFGDGELIQKKGAYNRKLSPKLSDGGSIISFENEYGEPVEKLHGEVELKISVGTYGEGARFFAGDKEISHSVEDGFYVVKTDASRLEVELCEDLSERKSDAGEASGQNLMFVFIGIAALLLVAFIFRKK